MEQAVAKGVAKQYFKSTKDRLSKNIELNNKKVSKTVEPKNRRKLNARPSLEKEEKKVKVHIS